MSDMKPTDPESKKAPAEERPQASKTPIEVAIESFVQEIGSLAATLPLVTTVVEKSAVAQFQELLKFVKEKCKDVKEGPNTFSVKVPPDVYQEYYNRKRKHGTLRLAQKTVPRSFFTSLVSHYDAYLGALLRATFYLRPELLNASEKPLSFKELTSFKSIEEARDFVVEREIEGILRESHDKQFDWMEARFKLPLRKDLPAWSKFIELMERRNLFVHCNGVVSTQYMNVCAKHGVDMVHCKLGDELQVPQEYFEQSYSVIFEIGVKLGHVLWRKLAPEARDRADWNLNELCLNLIRDEQYPLAKELLAFSTGQKKFSSDHLRRTLILNRAQVHKWSGDVEGMRKILMDEDWTACSEKFGLAVAVLRDEFQQAAKLMKRIGASGSPNKGDYKEWPIFKQFRRSPEFAKAYAEIFGEPYLESQTQATDSLPGYDHGS